MKKAFDIYEVPRGEGYVLARSNDGIGYIAVPHGESCEGERVAINVQVIPFHGTTPLETLGKPLGEYRLESGEGALCVVDE